jgi:hypothetical protein
VRGAAVARRLRAALLALVVALYVASIPWYRSGGAKADLWLGLPDWVAVALLCYAAVAVLNSIAWLLTEVPDRDGRDESERR